MTALAATHSVDPSRIPHINELDDQVRALTAQWLRALHVTEPGAIDRAVDKAMMVAGGRAARANGMGASAYYRRLSAGLPPHQAADSDWVLDPGSPGTPRAVARPGDRYGRLVVVEEAERQGRNRRVIVRCECGRTENVDARSLTSWRQWRECRRCRRITSGVVFRDGEPFGSGRWVIVGDYEPGCSQPVTVTCSRCGDTRTVHGSGCYGLGPVHCSGCNPRKARELAPGSQFGRWVVLGPAPRGRDGSPRSLCRCECGTEKAVHIDNLTAGKSRGCPSCGARNRRSAA